MATTAPRGARNQDATTMYLTLLSQRRESAIEMLLRAQPQYCMDHLLYHLLGNREQCQSWKPKREYLRGSSPYSEIGGVVIMVVQCIYLITVHCHQPVDNSTGPMERALPCGPCSTPFCKIALPPPQRRGVPTVVPPCVTAGHDVCVLRRRAPAARTHCSWRRRAHCTVRNQFGLHAFSRLLWKKHTSRSTRPFLNGLAQKSSTMRRITRSPRLSRPCAANSCCGTV